MTAGIFKSDEEVEKLLQHPNNGVKVEVKIIGSGNHGEGGHKGEKESRPAIREVSDKADISVLASLIGVKATSEMLDIHPAVVSNKKNGKTSSGDPDIEVADERDRRLGILSEKALSRVDILLDVISEEKIKTLVPVAAAATAEKMVNVYDKLRKKDPKELNEGRPSVVFYSPRQITLNDYRVQEVE